MLTVCMLEQRLMRSESGSVLDSWCLLNVMSYLPLQIGK